MDNRLRFLYCCMAELWGHRWRAQTGNGKTGASEVGVRLANPPYRPEDVMHSELKVAKCVSQLSRKAAIAHAVPVP